MTWTSPDGLTWTRSGDGLDVQGEFLGIVAVGHRFVAVGFECRPDCIDYRHDGLVATSADGLTWQVQALPTAAILSDVAGAGSRVFALGDVNAEQGPRAELQLWESDGGGDWHLVATSPTIPGTHSYRGYDLAVSADGAVTIVGWIENDDFQNFAYTRP